MASAAFAAAPGSFPGEETRRATEEARSDAIANRVVRSTCTMCHNDRLMTGNLSLQEFDVANAAEHADVAEAMVRKLRAGMMPPPGARRPGSEALLSLVETLESRLDEAAERSPNPGDRPFQRLNRHEYGEAIRDLLDLEVDAGDWLPLDQMSNNFDNIAEAQTLSATLLESYLNAASAISRLAIGQRSGKPVDHTYTNSQYLSQHPWDHVEGAPYGTRGGLVVDHTFTADAEYTFGVTFTSGANTRIEDIDVSIDGERVALLAYDTNRRTGADGRGSVITLTRPIFVRGRHPAHRRRLHPAATRTLRRPDPSPRLVLRRGRLGRCGHHDAAAHPRRHHHGSLQRDGPVGNAQPAPHLLLPSDNAGRSAALRPRDPRAARAGGVPAQPQREGGRRPARILRRGSRGRRFRSRDADGARGAARKSALRAAPRTGAAW